LTIAIFHRQRAVALPARRLAVRPIFAVILFFYLLFCPALNEGLYQGMAIHPSRDYIDLNHQVLMGDYIGNHVFFPVLNQSGEHVSLHGVYFKTTREKPLGTVILSPGNSFCLKRILGCEPAIRTLELGYNLFMYDYEGFGESGGVANYKKLGNDALSALTFVRDHLHQANIVLYGLSMGTGVSAYVAERAAVAGVILDSPYVTPEKTIKMWLPILNIYPSNMFPEPRYDNAAFLKGKHAPTLIITKGRDYITFTEQGLNLAKLATQPTDSLLLPVSTHFNIDARDDSKYLAALKEFLQKVSAGSPIAANAH
jgi:pimeloyl-ACP methyl ester carboxylesterase